MLHIVDDEDVVRDHQALALPLDVLRLLPEEYFRSLSPDTDVKAI